MSSFFSRFRTDPAQRPACSIDETAAAIYGDAPASPVWGTARDLDHESVCIASSSTFSTGSSTRIVLHGARDPILVAARVLWQGYDDSEYAILTRFALEGLSRANRRKIGELARERSQLIESMLVGVADLNPGDARQIAPFVHRRRVRSGRVIRGSADEGRDFEPLFLVEEGRVSLHLVGIRAERAAVGSIERGELFGIGASREGPVREVAIAEGDARLIEIGPRALDRMRDRDPRLALRVVGAGLRAAWHRSSEALLALESG